MTTVHIYDPAQCCATGACSPDADDELAQFASSLEWLKQSGVAVSRFNLGHEPGAFVSNTMVRSTIEKEGVGCLPMVVVNGTVLAKGRYPSRKELGDGVGISAPAATVSAVTANKRCCG
jgi:hypothetical protein